MIYTKSMDELREFVKTVLCSHHGLELSQFPLDESLLVRRGKPCGVYFCQFGPRQMKSHAVWDQDHGVLAFYDSSGQRFQKEQIVCKKEVLQSWSLPERFAA